MIAALKKKKQVEEALREAHDELEMRVEERTVELSKANEALRVEIAEHKQAVEVKLTLERQVLHAQKLESLGVLAGGIAHDFNNMLMSILGNADLALYELSPMSPARGNLREIEKATRRAADLAKQMLAYSGKGRFVVEPIDTGELVKEISHLLEVSISKKAVLKYNLAENLPTFDGDVTQIRQVFMNLITNASEAIGDNSGAIALSTGAMNCDRAYLDDVNEILRAGLHEPLREGVYTYFEVADTGCGMDAETIEKIFDPFFTTKSTGRGLGMSAVLGIVRGHKGALKIYSEVGKGTTFKLLFPANELPDNGFEVRRKDEAEGKDWRGSGTVLIADDEETICIVGKQMLERMGFSVLTAPDGREALKVFREHADEIVCVILDLTMPHMDGEEAFRAMRRFHPSITVLLCSGYNEQDATQRIAGKGLAGFIQKPYNMAALREKLTEVLRDERAALNGKGDMA
jgi:signal transduction histidine kinase/ActR/RegA family two-component response regulator